MSCAAGIGCPAACSATWAGYRRRLKRWSSALDAPRPTRKLPSNWVWNWRLTSSCPENWRCARITQLDELDVPEEGDATTDSVFDVSRREALVEAIGRLPEKESLMLSLYYTEGLNLKEIGLVLNVSESRVSQIHGQAVARLRSKLSDWR